MTVTTRRRQGPNEIDRRRELALHDLLWGLCNCPLTFHAMMDWGKQLKAGRLQPEDLVEFGAGVKQQPGFAAKLLAGLPDTAHAASEKEHERVPIETFERIAANCAKLSLPLEELLAAQQLGCFQISQQRYEAHRKLCNDIVTDLVSLNIRESLLDNLVDRLAPIRRRLRLVEKRLAELAHAYGVSDQEFMAAHRGRELEENWLERLAGSGDPCWANLLNRSSQTEEPKTSAASSG